MGALHPEPKAAKQATSTTPQLPGQGNVGQPPRTHPLLRWQRTIGNRAVQRMLQDRRQAAPVVSVSVAPHSDWHGATIQRVTTRISGKNIDLATAPTTDMQQAIAALIEHKDAAQLQLLRGALTIQIQENSQNKVEGKDLQALIELIDSVKTDKGALEVPKLAAPPLNVTDIKNEFRIRLRDGVQLIMKYHGLSDDESILRQALEPVTRGYIQFCQQSQHAKLLPPVEEIGSAEAIKKHYERLLNNKSILSSDIDAHLLGHSSTFNNPEDKEKYVEDQHHRARTKAAGTWAVVARAYFEVCSRLQTLSKTKAERGRDTAGRLAYLLMTISAKDLFEGLTGGSDIKEGVTDRTGIVKLVLDIADVFSTAACHKDAEQMMQLMADRLFVKGQADLKNKEDIAPLLATIVSALQACPGERCVLKLTNEQNHSAVYLVGEQTKEKQKDVKGAAKFETFAAQDAESILYNDLMESGAPLREVEGLVRAGLDKIARVYMGEPATLKWEVHTATDLQSMFGRVDTHLREGETALGVGLGVAEFERRERDKGPRHGIKETESGFLLPYKEIEASSLAGVFPMRATTRLKPGDLNVSAEYRVLYSSRWMKARYLGVRNDVPKWSAPAASFQILGTGEKFERPEEVRKADESRGEVNVRFLDIMRLMGYEGRREQGYGREGYWYTSDLTGKKYTTTDGDTFVLTDPRGPTAGYQRWMIATKL